MPATIGAKIQLDGAASFRQQLTQANTATRALKAEMKALKTSFDDETDAEGKNVAIRKQLSSQIDAQQKKIALLKGEVERASDAYGEGSTQVNRLRTQLANAEAELNGMESELRDVDAAADDMGDSLEEAARSGDGFTVLKGALADLASSGIQLVLDKVSSLTGEMVAASDSANKFASSLDFAGFDQSAIDEMTEATQRYADETVYDLGEIRNTTAALASNGVENAEGLVESLGNLNAVAGGSSSTFASVASALTQTVGAGKLTTENWNQVRDAIPGASSAIKDALLDAGAYTGDFAQALEDGEISAEEFAAAISTLGMTDAAVEAASSTETIEGAMGNLDASIVSVGATVVDEFKPKITEALTAAADAVSGLSDDFQSLMDWMGNNQGTVEALGSALVGVGAGIAAFSIASSIAGGVTALSAAFAALSASAAAAGGGIGGLMVALNLNPISLAIGAVVALGAGLAVFFTQTETGRKVFAKLKSAVQTAMTAVKTVVASSMGAAKSAISTGVTTIKSTFDKLKSIGASVRQAFDKVKKSMTEPIDKAKATVKGAIDAIKRLFPLNLGKIMNLKIPHISVSGGKAPFGIGGKGSLPHFSVNWYKRGGVFDSPTIIGVGDASTPEVVTPKQLMRETMDEALRANGAGGVTINVYGARSDSPEDFGRRAADAYNRLVMAGMGD